MGGCSSLAQLPLLAARQPKDMNFYHPLPTHDDGDDHIAREDVDHAWEDDLEQPSENNSPTCPAQPTANEKGEEHVMGKQVSLTEERKPRLSWLLDPPQLSWRDRGEEVLADMRFQICMAVLILCNALVIGLETDDTEGRFPWALLENLFLLVFTCELSLRLLVLGRKYWTIRSKDFFWNILDFSIVSFGLVDLLLTSLFATSGQGHTFATLFRIIRLLRILRIFRIVRFLKQLYLLAFGFVEAATAIFWVSLFMTFLLFVCSIVLVRTVGRHPEDDVDYQFFKSNFGTVPGTMLTLFELMANPDLTPYEGVMARNPLLRIFLICFLVLGSFGMIALLTGVISEAMFEKNQIRLEEERLEREQTRKSLMQSCTELFAEAETDANGCAPKGEVERLLPNIRQLFDSLSVPYAIHDMYRVVELMDTDDNGSISREEFCYAVVSFAEGVRPVSIMELHLQLAHLTSKFDKFDPVAQEARANARKADTLEAIAHFAQHVEQLSVALRGEVAEMTKSSGMAVDAMLLELRRLGEQFASQHRAESEVSWDLDGRLSHLTSSIARIEQQSAKADQSAAIASEIKGIVLDLHDVVGTFVDGFEQLGQKKTDGHTDDNAQDVGLDSDSRWSSVTEMLNHTQRLRSQVNDLIEAAESEEQYAPSDASLARANFKSRSGDAMTKLPEAGQIPVLESERERVDDSATCAQRVIAGCDCEVAVLEVERLDAEISMRGEGLAEVRERHQSIPGAECKRLEVSTTLEGLPAMAIVTGGGGSGDSCLEKESAATAISGGGGAAADPREAGARVSTAKAEEEARGSHSEGGAREPNRTLRFPPPG